MDATAEQRIKAIRLKVVEERAALGALNEKLTDLKELLRPCHNLLDDIDHFFLDKAILAEPRTPVALSKWLDQTEFVLQRSIRQRDYVEGLVLKFGANARIVRG